MSEEKENNLSLSSDIEKTLLQKNPNIFDGLTREKKDEILSSLSEIRSIEIKQVITREITRIAPIPTPEDIRGYYETKSEYADIIFEMAVKDQEYYHSRDNKAIDNDLKIKTKGQNHAFIIALVALFGGISCMLLGYEIGGTIIGGVGLTSLISEFLEKPFTKLIKRKK